MNFMIRFIFWPLFFMTQLISLCLIAWHLMVQVNFVYPLGYKILHINQHIQTFAPKNRFRDDFELTTETQHWEIFAQITQAVQKHGEGLTEIKYNLANGESTSFMHNAEIIHLQDVANLIDGFYTLGTISLLLWALFLAIAYHHKLPIPSVKNVLLGFFICVVSIATTILGIGATKVFYWFHVHLFPEGHTWFFYYEDSLMTTLMKAPEIFGFIAALLVFLVAVLWITSSWISYKLLSTKTTTKLLRKNRNKKIKYKN